MQDRGEQMKEDEYTDERINQEHLERSAYMDVSRVSHNKDFAQVATFTRAKWRDANWMP